MEGGKKRGKGGQALDNDNYDPREDNEIDRDSDTIVRMD